MSNGVQGRSRRRLFFAVLLAIGCSGGVDPSGCGGGCGGDGGGCAPIPGGFQGPKTNNAITAKFSANGFRFIEDNLATIVQQFAGQSLTFDIPCTEASSGVFVCDLNKNGRCDAGDETHPSRVNNNACRANAEIRQVGIVPKAAANGTVDVEVTVRVYMKTGEIAMIADAFITDIECRMDFDAARGPRPLIPVDVTLNMKIDPVWGHVLAIDMSGLDLVDSIDSEDLRVRGNFLCDIANVNFIKDLVLDFAKGPIDDMLVDVLDSVRCRACGEPGPDQCPTAGVLASVCDQESNLCYTNRERRECPPAILGMETRFDAASMLADFGARAGSLIDLYAVAGGRNPDGLAAVKEDNGGLVIGIMGGSDAPMPSACVPMAQWFPRGDPSVIDYDGEAAAGGFPDYKVGIGVSDTFMDKALFDAYSSGAICLEVGGETIDLLTSGLFSTFLPSLGVLTDGADVPLLIAIRPRTAPDIVIGKGTTKTTPDGKVVPDDPLITVKMDSLQLDFYAFLEERYTRLFSLTSDVRLPLALEFNPTTNTVTPALGSLDTLLTNVVASNSKMLSENPQDLADLIGSLIGMIQPLLGDALSPIELPEMEGFKLIIPAGGARGVNKFPVGDGYEHLVLYADLEMAPPVTTQMISTVQSRARLVESFVPSKAELFGAERRDAVAVIDVEALSATRTDLQGYEHSWRLNGGLWSPWHRNSRIEVRSPVLRLQGRHLIEVRSREIDQPATTSLTPAAIPFAVDYEPPTVRLEYDREADRVVTVATDRVTDDEKLTYAYRVAGGHWSSFGPKSEFRLVQLGDEPSLEVKVRDPAGNEAWAVYGTGGDQVAWRPGATSASATEASSGGCAQTVPSMAALLGLVAVLRRRRVGR